MLAHLLSLARRFREKGQSPFFPPLDPEIPVREPTRRGPGGRHSAIALDEPDDGTFVRASHRDRGDGDPGGMSVTGE